MKPDYMSQEEWDALEEAEQEAILEDEGEDDDADDTNDDGADADDAAANADDDSADDNADEDDTNNTASDDNSESAADEGEGADADSDSADQRNTRQEQPRPVLNAQVPDDADDQLKAIGTKRDELDTQFDDGDLTSTEYRTAMRELDKQENAIEQAQFKANLAQEMEQTQRLNAWMDTVNTFLDENQQYRNSQLLGQSLDTKVKEIAADEANASLSGRQILEKAHEAVTTELGLAPQQQAKGKAKRPDLPPNLSKVPAAETTGTSDAGKYAKLDNLMDTDPQAYEDALAGMTDEQRDAYLASQ